MRFGTTKTLGILAATALWAGLSAPADAACKTLKCAKESAAIATASAMRTAAPAKAGKRKHYASSKVKSGHRRHGVKFASAVSRGKRSALPASIANARAELTTNDFKPKSKSLAEDEARNIAALDDNDVVTINGVQISPRTQLNSLDRMAENEQKPEEAQPNADIARPAIQAAEPTQSGRILKAVPKGERHVLENTDSDTWSKTSFIGKLFVAFGSLLTLASAARLMIA